MTPITSLVIATDYRVFGECLALALAGIDAFTVLAIANHMEEALRKVKECQPDIVLLDGYLSNRTSLVLTKQLIQDSPQTMVLVLGVVEEEADIREYVEAGASGYVSREMSLDELKVAIELVARGETLCSPHIVYSMFSRLTELARTFGGSETPEPMILSMREREILQLVAKGWSNKQIANHLFLSLHTVKNHVHNILRKLQVQRRSEAVEYASQRRWVQVRRS
jgi:DNA-binding NarL/FixJ family response regulator